MSIDKQREDALWNPPARQEFRKPTIREGAAGAGRRIRFPVEIAAVIENWEMETLNNPPSIRWNFNLETGDIYLSRTALSADNIISDRKHRTVLDRSALNKNDEVWTSSASGRIRPSEHFRDIVAQQKGYNPFLESNTDPFFYQVTQKSLGYDIAILYTLNDIQGDIDSGIGNISGYEAPIETFDLLSSDERVRFVREHPPTPDLSFLDDNTRE